MSESSSNFLKEKKRKERPIDNTRKCGKVAREVQIYPGEMLDNVSRINRTLTALEVPHRGNTARKKSWGYSDTLSYIVEWGAEQMVRSADFQAMEREAERLRREKKKETAILDAIIDKDVL